MAYSLEDKLVVAVSSRALFDLEVKNQVFEENGLDAYYKYQLENENKPLKKGTGYRLIQNLLDINNYFDKTKKQVEVLILSKNNAGTSLRITNAINEHNLDIYYPINKVSTINLFRSKNSWNSYRSSYSI